MCDLHVELFRESIIKDELKEVPEGHPLYTLIMENNEVLKDSEKLNLYATSLLYAEGENKYKIL